MSLRTAPTITKGKVKCKLKKRFNVGLSTAKPPHNQSTIYLPIKGIAENKFVITVSLKNQVYSNLKIKQILFKSHPSIAKKQTTKT
jgi:hypothetical protein